MPRAWPGVPTAIWPALNYLLELTERVPNIRSDLTLQVQQNNDGAFLTVPDSGRLLVVITGGSNPYSWRKLIQNVQGSVDVLQAAQQGDFGTTTDTPAGTSPTFRPAYERNGNRNVLPGTIVWLDPRGVALAGSDVVSEYDFDYCERFLNVQLTTSGAPVTALASNMTAAQGNLTVTGNTSFPCRTNYKIKVGSEVMEVTAGSGSNTFWLVDRGTDATTAAIHPLGTSVTLVGNYAWTEQIPPETGNDEWVDQIVPLTGSFNDQPVRERNANPFVPDLTYALIRRKSIDGAGSTNTINVDYNSSTSSIAVLSASSFPRVLPYYVRIDGEYMRVNIVNGLTPAVLTVNRGMYFSQPAQHEAGSPVTEAICEWVFDHCCTDGSAPTNDLVEYEESTISSNTNTWTVSGPKISWIWFNPTVSVTVGGFKFPGGNEPGKGLKITNDAPIGSGKKITIPNQNPGTSFGDQAVTFDQIEVVIAPQETVKLEYGPGGQWVFDLRPSLLGNLSVGNLTAVNTIALPYGSVAANLQLSMYNCHLQYQCGPTPYFGARNPLTGKGSLLAGSDNLNPSTELERTVGPDGTQLTANSADPTGLSWNPPTSPLTVKGTDGLNITTPVSTILFQRPTFNPQTNSNTNASLTVNFGLATSLVTDTPGLVGSAGTSALLPRIDHSHPQVLNAFAGTGLASVVGLGSGSYNDYTPSPSPHFPARQQLNVYNGLAPVGPITFTGFDSSTFNVGDLLLVQNADPTYSITITNLDGASSSNNQVRTATGQNILLPPGCATLLTKYLAVPSAQTSWKELFTFDLPGNTRTVRLASSTMPNKSYWHPPFGVAATADVTFSAGTHNNYVLFPVDTNGVGIITSGGSSLLTGIDSTNFTFGDMIYLAANNLTAGTFTLAHNSSSSSVGNRIFFISQRDTELTGTMIFVLGSDSGGNKIWEEVNTYPELTVLGYDSDSTPAHYTDDSDHVLVPSVILPTSGSYLIFATVYISVNLSVAPTSNGKQLTINVIMNDATNGGALVGSSAYSVPGSMLYDATFTPPSTLTLVRQNGGFLVVLNIIEWYTPATTPATITLTVSGQNIASESTSYDFSFGEISFIRLPPTF